MGTKMSNGISVELTAEEQTAHDAAQVSAHVALDAEAIVIAQKATDKTNGNQKMLDLGLSQAEVDALTK